MFFSVRNQEPPGKQEPKTNPDVEPRRPPSEKPLPPREPEPPTPHPSPEDPPDVDPPSTLPPPIRDLLYYEVRLEQIGRVAGSEREPGVTLRLLNHAHTVGMIGAKNPAMAPTSLTTRETSAVGPSGQGHRWRGL